MILDFYWQINALMFLALQHSTYAAIHDLVARAMFLETAVLLLSLFISEISGVSVGWMFTSVCGGCWEAISIKQCCGGVNFI